MTGGFATIAGTVLASYISFGIDAAQLISASVMAAPAALAYSKLFYPETEKSKTSVGELTSTVFSEKSILVSKEGTIRVPWIDLLMYFHESIHDIFL